MSEMFYDLDRLKSLKVRNIYNMIALALPDHPGGWFLFLISRGMNDEEQGEIVQKYRYV